MDEDDRTLQALKRHPLYPFPNYQKDEEQYRLSEVYWRALFHRVVSGGSAWPVAFYAPDLEREGNPIFSAVDHDTKRQTVIAQFPRDGENGVALFPTAYLSRSLGHQFDYDYTYLALGIIADISVESEALCREFWQWFFIDKLSEAELENRMRQHEMNRPPSA